MASLRDYLNRDVSKHDTDLERASLVVCPDCGSREIRASSTFHSMLFTGSVAMLLAGSSFVVLIFLKTERLALFLVLAAVFCFAAFLASSTSAVFGRDRCRACGHLWR